MYLCMPFSDRLLISFKGEEVERLHLWKKIWVSAYGTGAFKKRILELIDRDNGERKNNG